MEKFVFVHGAWLGAWCWDKVSGILHEKGARTLSIDLPGHGNSTEPIEGQDIHTYAAAIVKVLEAQEEPVILVGHSMGGMSISEAAAMAPDKVKKLVYVAAFLPKDGEANNFYGDIKGIQPMDWIGMGHANIGVVLNEDETVMTLTPDFAVPALYNDIPEEIGRALCELHGPDTIASPYTAVHLNEAFDKIPKYYIKCSQDGILTVDIQEKMLAATPVKKLYELDAGHCPYISRAEELADALCDIQKDQ